MQKAYTAGIEKIIIVDERIFALSLEKNGLIGENKKFASEQELDEFLLTLPIQKSTAIITNKKNRLLNLSLMKNIRLPIFILRKNGKL